MLNVLNRLSWFVSIAMGFAILSSFGIGEVSWIFAVILGVVLKKIFFSHDFLVASLGKVGEREVAQENERLAAYRESVARETVRQPERAPTPTTARGPIPLPDSPFAQMASELNQDGTLRNIKQPSETLDQGYAKHFRAQEVEHDEHAESQNNSTIQQFDNEPSFIQKFFQENALAKIGGILLFLGVMFLLQLVYTAIGPVGKLMIGFAVGFIVFGVGVFLDRKGQIGEARILLGIGILINYLVILSGRFLIGETVTMPGDLAVPQSMLLSEGLTMIFLVLNTVFAVFTSIVYNSHAPLFFSFVVAYLNPFLIGAQPTSDPYTLVGYSLIVSLGAIILSYVYREKFKRYSSGLLNTAFLGGNLLILLAPFNTTSEWLVKLAAMATLSLITIFMAYANQQKESIAQHFVITYVFLVLLIGFGSSVLGAAFSGFSIMFGYLVFLGALLISSVVIFSTAAVTSLFYIFFAPLLILIGLIFADVLMLGNILFVLMGAVILYLLIFIRLVGVMALWMKYIFFSLLGVFILLISGFVGSGMSSGFTGMKTAGLLDAQIYGVMITTFLFLFSAYYFSSKKNLEYLYSLGTVFGIAMLLPVLSRDGSMKSFSIVSVVLLVFLNIVMPFINRQLLENNIRNLVIGLVTGVLFAVGELFYFLLGDADMSKMTLGVSFLGLAVCYFAFGFVLYERMRSLLRAEVSIESKATAQNVVYAFLGISISLFSLAVAYIFSKHSEVISAVWLFEATLMFYFYGKAKDLKIYAAGIVLMFIGLVELSVLLTKVHLGDYLSLIPLTVIFGSLVASLKFLESEEREVRYIHDLGHILTVGLIGALLVAIIPHYQSGYSLFGISSFFLVLFLVYSRIYSAGIKTVLALAFVLALVYHTSRLYTIFDYLELKNLEYLKLIQYMATIVFALGVTAFNFVMTRHRSKSNYSLTPIYIINIALSLYLFVISTMFVYDWFSRDNAFVITIYWGVLAFAFLSQGIARNLIKYRTIGLYILALTVIKILFKDVWSVDEAVTRIVALMIVGALMIIISLLYSKKYGGNLKGEWDLKNLEA